MTEEEAKKKCCPMVQHWNCIASDCMMWRFLKMKGTQKDASGFETEVTTESKDIGYCGLAGKP